jgi:hypothetical protein
METVTIKTTTYEIVGEGCATGMANCTHSRPLTVHALDARGRRRFEHLAECIEDPR